MSVVENTQHATTGAATARHPAPTTGSPATLRVTQARVIRSEWIKLRSVRSWAFMIIGAMAIMISFGALAAAVSSGSVASPDNNGGGPGFGTDPTAISLAGVMLAQLLVGVLGVLVISNEYANGMIRATFAAVPRRIPVLVGKVVVLAGALVVTMLVAVMVAFLLGQSILGDGHNTTLAADGVLRAVLGSALYLAGIGIFGIAIGTLLRSTAGAISTVVAVLLLVPTLASLVLPDSWSANITPYLPSNAGTAFTSVTATTANLLSPGAGAAVFVGWLVVLLAGAAVVMRKRDA